MNEIAGYLHPDYAYSLREFGKPLELSQCGGWILERMINDTPYKDAMGCYPLFVCRNWSKLGKDLEQVGSRLVSLALVTDPFAEVTSDYLKRYFDIVRPFKKHYVTNFSYPLDSFIDKTHCSTYYYAQRSLKKMEVFICNEPIKYINEWTKLYENLVNRHKIRGIIAFSPKSFKTQLKLPGTIMAIGLYRGEIVGAGIIFIQGRVSYFHLAAYSDTGYKIRASYGIFWKVLNYLQEQGIDFLDIGGSAGIEDDPKDGLARFKRGWSNETHLVYFCGRILDRQKYETLCQQLRIADSGYFPAYRQGEFI
jgi:hypothetical protein